MEKSKKDALERLLEGLLVEAKLQTNFMASLDADRLYTALFDASFLGVIEIILYDELAPLATSTQRINIPNGFYYLQWKYVFDISIPWYMFCTATIPGVPILVDPCTPAHQEIEPVGYFPLRDWIEFMGLNLHATENNRYHIISYFAVISTETWDMIKRVFLDPINIYIRDKAEELSGVPY